MIRFLKKIIMGAFIIYAFNIIAVNFNIVLPINIWTISFTSIFDFLGIAILLIIKVIGV